MQDPIELVTITHLVVKPVSESVTLNQAKGGAASHALANDADVVLLIGGSAHMCHKDAVAAAFTDLGEDAAKLIQGA